MNEYLSYADYADHADHLKLLTKQRDGIQAPLSEIEPRLKGNNEHMKRLLEFI